MTAKQRALESYIEQNDLQNKDASEVQELMGKFEVNWENITKQTPEWYTPEKLLEFNTNDLKVIIDTGILDTKPDILGLVTTMYETRSRISPEDIDTKQEALREYLALPENKNKTGLDKIKIITDFETTWKDDTAKTPDFVPVMLFLDGDSVRATNQAAYDAAIADGFNEVQLGKISQISKDLNVDRKTASEISNGTLKLGTNVRGETTLTNIATGVIKVLGAAQTSDAATEDLTLDQAIADGASINPDSNVNWRTTTTTFQVPETIVDGRVVPAQTIQVTPRMIQEAENLNIDFDNIGDIKSAFGLKGAIAKGVGQLGGLIGQDWQPETNDAIAYLENLRLNTLITLAGTAANGLRDSVWNKQQILTTLAEPGRVWKGAASQYRKLKLTTLEIDKGIEVSMAEINSPTSNPERQAKAKVTLAALKSLKTKYDKVLSVFDKDVTLAPKPKSSYITQNDKDGL